METKQNNTEEMSELLQTQQIYKDALNATTQLLAVIPKLALLPKVSEYTRKEILEDSVSLARFVNVAISEAMGFNEMLEDMGIFVKVTKDMEGDK